MTFEIFIVGENLGVFPKAPTNSVFERAISFVCTLCIEYKKPTSKMLESGDLEIDRRFLYYIEIIQAEELWDFFLQYVA